MTLNEYIASIKSKNVAVVGIGVSNLPLIDFLISCGANVTACDKMSRDMAGENILALEKKGVALRLGENYLSNLDFDVIFKSPGIRPDIPEFEMAKRNGAILTSEMELFFEICPCRIIAVTGSDGKTTTTTLIGEMLKKEGYTCHIGGNIGKPLVAEVESMTEKDMAILELSSFQLFTMRKSPEIAVITNISPNHLDWHKDFNEYIDAKKNIMKYQKESDVLITNVDNDISKSIGSEAKAENLTFSRMGDGFVHIESGAIFYGDEKVINVSDINLPGTHNVENYMAAIGAVRPFVSLETIEYIAKNFGGVEHRIEFVREINGIKFYNDSIASSPTRTMAALNSFDDKIVLIAGGYDKKIPFDELGVKINEKVRELVLVGDTAEKIKKAVLNAGNSVNITVCNTFEEAVMTAYNKAKPGENVVLSPACASFDLFKNFMLRGETFKNIVNGI